MKIYMTYKRKKNSLDSLLHFSTSVYQKTCSIVWMPPSIILFVVDKKTSCKKSWINFLLLLRMLTEFLPFMSSIRINPSASFLRSFLYPLVWDRALSWDRAHFPFPSQLCTAENILYVRASVTKKKSPAS